MYNWRHDVGPGSGRVGREGKSFFPLEPPQLWACGLRKQHGRALLHRPAAPACLRMCQVHVTCGSVGRRSAKTEHTVVVTSLDGPVSAATVLRGRPGFLFGACVASPASSAALHSSCHRHEPQGRPGPCFVAASIASSEGALVWGDLVFLLPLACLAVEAQAEWPLD